MTRSPFGHAGRLLTIAGMLTFATCLTPPAMAAGTGYIFVSNEKSHDISVLDPNDPRDREVDPDFTPPSRHEVQLRQDASLCRLRR